MQWMNKQTKSKIIRGYWQQTYSKVRERYVWINLRVSYNVLWSCSSCTFYFFEIGSHYIVWLTWKLLHKPTGLVLRDPPTSASRFLGLKARVTLIFLKVYLLLMCRYFACMYVMHHMYVLFVEAKEGIPQNWSYSWHMGTSNWTWVTWKSSLCSKY